MTWWVDSEDYCCTFQQFEASATAGAAVGHFRLRSELGASRRGIAPSDHSGDALLGLLHDQVHDGLGAGLEVGPLEYTDRSGKKTNT